MKTKGKSKGKSQVKAVSRTMSPAQIKARKKWQAKQIKAGKCVACTRKAIKNKLTGKRGLRCRMHQDQANKYNQKYKKGGTAKKKTVTKLTVADRKKAAKLVAKRKHDAEVKRQKRAALKEAVEGHAKALALAKGEADAA